MGDEIRVFDANAANYDFTVDTISGVGSYHVDEEATFEVDDPEKIAFLKDIEIPEKYVAFYPYAGFDATDNTVSMTIPFVQYYDYEVGHGGSFTTNTYPMFGVNDAANHFQFHSHAGVLQFNFGALPDRYVKVKQIIVTAPEGDALVGTMTYPFDYPFNAYDPYSDAYTISNTSNEVVLNCGEGVVLPNDGYSYLRFSIALLRGALAEGFHIMVIGDKNDPDNPEIIHVNVVLLDAVVDGPNSFIEAEKVTSMTRRNIPVPGYGG